MFGLSNFRYDDDGFRTCSVTGLDIHRSAEDMVKLFGVTAILALAVQFLTDRLDAALERRGTVEQRLPGHDQ